MSAEEQALWDEATDQLRFHARPGHDWIDTLNRLWRKNRFVMSLEGAEFYCLRDAKRHRSPADFSGRLVHAVAGIGNPERFFSHLRGLGVSFLAHPFPDHHRYAPSDLDFADADAVIMTEKDAIKCGHFARDEWWVLPVEARVDPALADAVVRKLRTARGRQTA